MSNSKKILTQMVIEVNYNYFRNTLSISNDQILIRNCKMGGATCYVKQISIK